LPGLDFIPINFHRRGVAGMRPLSIPNSRVGFCEPLLRREWPGGRRVSLWGD